jgi:predicted phosphodiesterase
MKNYTILRANDEEKRVKMLIYTHTHAKKIEKNNKIKLKHISKAKKCKTIKKI